MTDLAPELSIAGFVGWLVGCLVS